MHEVNTIALWPEKIAFELCAKAPPPPEPVDKVHEVSVIELLFENVSDASNVMAYEYCDPV